VTVTLADLQFMWTSVILPRQGDVYVFGGSLSPTAVQVGTDCSGAVSEVNEALLYGPAMTWLRQFSTLSFAGAKPGDTGLFGGVASTSDWVCVDSYADIPPGSPMVVAVLQLPDPTQAHMVCAVLDPTNLTGFNPTLDQTKYVGIESGGQFTDAQGNSTLHIGSEATGVDNPMFNQWFYLKGPITITVSGVDFSGGIPGGAAIASAGYAFACRYVFDGLPGLPYKLLTKTEADDLLANNVGPVSNYESTGVDATNGFNQGAADAAQGNANHLAAGGPPDRPIYFSLDWDEAEAQDATVDAYFQGVASVIGLGRTGVYGGYWICNRLLNAGLVTWVWQTEAWSTDPNRIGPDGPDGTYLDARANILQRNTAGFVSINGVQCDIDIAYTTDYGQWNYSGGDDQMTPEEHAWLAQLWGALFNPIASQSPFATPGEGAIWQQHQLPINDDAMLHPMFTEWAARHGDPGSLAQLQAVAASSGPFAALAQSVLTEIQQGRSWDDDVIPTPVAVPVKNGAPVPGTITINEGNVLQWVKDAVTVLGAIGTWATAVHSVLGQYLDGATGAVVPGVLALGTAGLAGHSVHQRKTAVKALKEGK
jgi:hypothetical protein